MSAQEYKIQIFQEIFFGESLIGREFIRKKYGLGEFHQVVVDGKANKFGAVLNVKF